MWEHATTPIRYPRVVVSGDAIRLALGHRFNTATEGFVDATKHTMIKALLQDHDVLVDGTHSKEDHILRLFEIDQDAQYYIVDTTPEICTQRAVDTNQQDLCRVIDRVYGQMRDLASSYGDYKFWDSILENIPETIECIRATAVSHGIYD